MWLLEREREKVDKCAVYQEQTVPFTTGCWELCDFNRVGW